MKFFEKRTVHHIKTGETSYRVVEIEQPAFYRVRGLLVWRLDRLTYKAPVFKHLWRYGERGLDAVARRLHSRHCDADCGVAYQRLETDPRGLFPMTDDRQTRICARLPLGARYDCWIYDIAHARQKTVATYTAQ